MQRHRWSGIQQRREAHDRGPKSHRSVYRSGIGMKRRQIDLFM
jgi:hypothetical protein